MQENQIQHKYKLIHNIASFLLKTTVCTAMYTLSTISLVSNCPPPPCSPPSRRSVHPGRLRPTEWCGGPGALGPPHPHCNLWLTSFDQLLPTIMTRGPRSRSFFTLLAIVIAKLNLFVIGSCQKLDSPKRTFIDAKWDIWPEQKISCSIQNLAMLINVF